MSSAPADPICLKQASQMEQPASPVEGPSEASLDGEEAQDLGLLWGGGEPVGPALRKREFSAGQGR